MSWSSWVISTWKNLWKWKSTRWKEIIFPNCENTMPNTKSKTSISKTKGFGKVHMNQHWSSLWTENFERLKNSFHFNSLSKILIFMNWMIKKGHYHEIMWNKTSIEVGESNKTLNISNSSPIHNGMRIHVNVIFRNDAIQGLHFNFM